VIIAGNWNVVRDYRVDTLNYTGENNPKSKLKMNQMINSMDLVDVWREKHPGVRRYTWGAPDKKQNGHDYFLVSSDIDTLGYSIKLYIRERCFLNVSELKEENELIDMQQVLSQNI
jgi:exonuclease III